MDILYFVGLLPPEPIRNEITKFKEFFDEKYGVRHALKSPPHITMIPPFKWPEQNEKSLIDDLSNFASTETTFPVRLENFGAFSPRVIFVDVVKNDSLEKMYERLTAWLKDKWRETLKDTDLKRFHPHVTVAFKDLRREHFRDAWPGFRDKKVNFEFTADGLTLLKHTGSWWKIHFKTAFSA